MKLAIGLGSSLGDRRRTLEITVRQLQAGGCVRLLRVSRWVATPPLAGGPARNWFLNGVALVDVDIPLEDMLERCQQLEASAGRRRNLHWGDRPLDVDLLVADEVCREGPGLVLPHPAIADRPFVLEPLLEIWPDATDPCTGTPYANLPRPPGPRPWLAGVFPHRPILST